MGHKGGLQGLYDRPEETIVLEDYLTAINTLTINDENRLKEKVATLEEKQSEIDMLKLEHNRQMRSLEDKVIESNKRIISKDERFFDTWEKSMNTIKLLATRIKHLEEVSGIGGQHNNRVMETSIGRI